ncbi:NAD-glutamate dehydrogenase [Mycobacterium sp. AT1]|uniref:NAD-glutamate dehydrogenase n=1 Tax=Mycobacterium sp. AT1 TaxID=1961706 RepID=UPI0009AEF01D|nr:NAD-glutamate dehydrogenase [Mycobacterium sp. AT1]OPX05542.1 hypothetical protein B1790_31335 [Mycobacterium sp. AT1]
MREFSSANRELVQNVVAAGWPLNLDTVSESTAASAVASFYELVPGADLAHRTPEELYRTAANHIRLAATRPVGTDAVDVATPSAHDDPPLPQGGNTMITIVTDDIPMLFDSLVMELTAQQRGVHVALHPQISVVRDKTTWTMRGISNQVVDADAPDSAVCREAWIQIEVERETDPHQLKTIELSMRRVIADVRKTATDQKQMLDKACDIADQLTSRTAPGISDTEIAEARELLAWLADGNFTFLGYRQYDLTSTPTGELLQPVEGVGLGILRPATERKKRRPLPKAVGEQARDRRLLVLTKSNSKSTVHRPEYLDYVGVKRFDPATGEIIGEHRFLGLYASSAYSESVFRIPVIRHTATAVLHGCGFTADSDNAATIIDILQSYPRDELFQAAVTDLLPIAETMVATSSWHRPRLFLRRDPYGRFLTCILYMPRDHYNTAVRERISDVLIARLGGSSVEFTARLGEQRTAQVRFVLRPGPDSPLKNQDDIDADELEDLVSHAAQSWQDEFVRAARAEFGETVGAGHARKFAAVFPPAYQAENTATTAARDLRRIENLTPTDQPWSLHLTQHAERAQEARLKIYTLGSPVELSDILPVLASFGLDVTEERAYELLGLNPAAFVYDFTLRVSASVDPSSLRLLEAAIVAVRNDSSEADGFNRLVLRAGVSWRQISILRAYAKYMRQIGSPFAPDSIEDTLNRNADVARMLISAFEAKFDPTIPTGQRAARVTEAMASVSKAIDAVDSLDHDRILRSYATMIDATDRTNHYKATSGATSRCLALKVRPTAIPDTPAPRPLFEVFVHSPRVEGVHMRFGLIARGGLRWSDRRDDFRTEILGLAKAQMVKNSLIVPVGAKGGFFCKKLPDAVTPAAAVAEATECYKLFVAALLDITDNSTTDGAVRHPDGVVCHDGADPYLVVAADKGTASFSDIANDVSADYQFWLGDAFASGGSVGFDHKKMGITARGAWQSVQRHFRERGIDCQTTDFTCVGIGDMSGDVFGNGMLLSRHTKLVAAFDHRHIFIDPDPDPEYSRSERRRLFHTPGSTWADYDPSILSAGGGVFSRKAKSIPLTPEMCRALSIPADSAPTTMTPDEVIRAILLAEVDLLWNGGIGTYIRASTETDTEVGDKANDGIRVVARAVKAHIIGEGGNLGLTQRARIEYARFGCGGHGGRINTDFIDNAAGVNTSDREVNIKILLASAVNQNGLTRGQRDALLLSMTDDVANLVIRDNYSQNAALADSIAESAILLHVHEDWMRELESRGLLNRELEFLPSTAEVTERMGRGEGLSGPELATLLAYTKIALTSDLLASNVIGNRYFDVFTEQYFPPAVRELYGDLIHQHPLRKEITATQILNRLVDGAGITFCHRLAEETGAPLEALVQANFASRAIFDIDPFVDQINALDNTISSELQTEMRLEVWGLVERSTRWLINNRGPLLDAGVAVSTMGLMAQNILALLPTLMQGDDLAAFRARKQRLTESGVPEDIAERVAVMPRAQSILTIVNTILDHPRPVEPRDIAKLYFSLGDRLGFSTLVTHAEALPREDRWQMMARAAIRDDIHHTQESLVEQVLDQTTAGLSIEQRIDEWEKRGLADVNHAASTLTELVGEEQPDLGKLTVAVKTLKTLITIRRIHPDASSPHPSVHTETATAV